MRRCIALLLAAVVPVAGAGDPESIWVSGDGEYFTDPVNWSGPPPDETVTCIFDIPDKRGPFISFDEAGLSGRAIIRAGHPYFVLWEIDPEDGPISHHYDVVNPNFNTSTRTPTRSISWLRHSAISTATAWSVSTISFCCWRRGAHAPTPPPAACPADLDGDGIVGISDLLILFAQWSE